MHLELKHLLGSRSTSSQRYWREERPEDYKKILQCAGLSFAEKLYNYIHGTEPYKCSVCGNLTKFKNHKVGYNRFCSIKCMSQSSETKEKTKHTCRERYGCDVPSQSPEIREKVKQTCLERFGVTSPSKSQQIKEKTKQTCLKRFGADGPMANKEVMQKSKETLMKKYGVDHISKVQETKDKIANTKQERYGDSGYNNIEKIRQTCLERYGVENVGSVKEIRERMGKTIHERYGGMGNASPEILEKFKDTCIKRYNKVGYNNREQAKQTILEKYGVENYSHISAKQLNPELIERIDGYWICRCPHPGCNKCSENTYSVPYPIFYDRKRLGIEPCTHLLPIQPQYSTAELIIRDILDELKVRYECNKRDIIAPKEIDIYLTDFKIGIEINGVYWHSKEHKDDYYHIDKYKACREAGVVLITLWEDQIFNDLSGCLDLILYHLGFGEKFPAQFDPTLIDNGLVDREIEPILVEHDGFECWTGKQKETK